MCTADRAATEVAVGSERWVGKDSQAIDSHVAVEERGDSGEAAVVQEETEAAIAVVGVDYVCGRQTERSRKWTRVQVPAMSDWWMRQVHWQVVVAVVHVVVDVVVDEVVWLFVPLAESSSKRTCIQR